MLRWRTLALLTIALSRLSVTAHSQLTNVTGDQAQPGCSARMTHLCSLRMTLSRIVT